MYTITITKQASVHVHVHIYGPIIIYILGYVQGPPLVGGWM